MTSSSSTPSSTTTATSNVDSLLNQVRRNLGLPLSTRSNSDNSGFIDAAPFAIPFAKGERIYRIADWISSSESKTGPVSSSTRVRGSSAGLTGLEEEDWTLSLTESSAKTVTSARKAVGIRPTRGILPPRITASSTSTRNQTRTGPTKGIHATGAKHLGWGQRAHDRQKIRESSIKIDPTWSIMEEIEFSRISKLQYDPEEPELLASGGSVKYFNKSFDRLTTKSSKPVNIEDVTLPAYVSLSEDPIVKDLANKLTGSVVFMTDSVAALLMASPRTVIPWDLLTTRISPNCVIIDQGIGSNFNIEHVQVSETANEPPADDRDAFNSAQNLAIEASRINAALPHIICSSEESFTVGNDCCEAPAGSAYKYYKWTMGEDQSIVIRSQINGANKISSTQQNILIRSLLEFDSSRAGVNIDWRSKLDNQRGAVLATEIKNNNSVIARWVFQAYLAQADNIKLAYVSRISQKDRLKHELLALQDVEPYELAIQMNLDTANGFGILKALFDLFTRTQNSVVIARDPTKPMLRLFEIIN